MEEKISILKPNEEIQIDWPELNKLKALAVEIRKQINFDYTVDSGSSLHREDADIAMMVCLLSHSFKIVKSKPR